MAQTVTTEKPSEVLPSAKRDQILQAATLAFMNGFATTSMDAIAREANVSKATLYAHFPSKDALFAAIIQARCQQMANVLEAPNIDELPVREALRQFANALLELAVSPDALAVMRVIVAEVPRFPQLGRTLFELGPQRMLGRLAAYLRRACDRGQLEIEDTELAAVHLTEMAKGQLHLRGLLGIEEQLTPQDREHRVDVAVDAFLRCYGPRAPSAQSTQRP
jgi:AcrR family transcriptional regulator